MIGVILAAGDGKRLKKSSSEDSCKPLIKIKGKRLIEYSLDNLIELDVEKAFIVVGKDDRDEVMKNIMEEAGIMTENKGICFSLPVDTALGLAGKTGNIEDMVSQ